MAVMVKCFSAAAVYVISMFVIFLFSYSQGDCADTKCLQAVCSLTPPRQSEYTKSRNSCYYMYDLRERPFSKIKNLFLGHYRFNLYNKAHGLLKKYTTPLRQRVTPPSHSLRLASSWMTFYGLCLPSCLDKTKSPRKQTVPITY